jgi:phosphate transport system substrate-binding protein
MIGVIAGPAVAGDPGRKCLRIQGAHVALGLVDKRVHAFSQEHPSFCAVVSGAKPLDALKQLCDGSVDMAVVGRKLNEKQKAGFCRNGGTIEQVLVGMAAPALVVQARNSVDSLTLEQVRKIFTGEYTNWADVGGSNVPIRVLAASPKKSVASKMFRMFVLGGKPYSPKAALVNGSYGLLDLCARSDGHAIAVVPYAFYSKSKSAQKVKLIAIKHSEGEPGVKPSTATLADGSYFLRKPIYLCWNTTSRRSVVLARFADFNSKRLAVKGGTQATALRERTRKTSVQ